MEVTAEIDVTHAVSLLYMTNVPNGTVNDNSRQMTSEIDVTCVVFLLHDEFSQWVLQMTTL